MMFLKNHYFHPVSPGAVLLLILTFVQSVSASASQCTASDEGPEEYIEDSLCSTGANKHRVLTPTGLRPLHTLRKGDVVFTVQEGRKKLERQAVLDAFCREESTGYEMKLPTETLELGQWQPVYTVEDGWVPGSQLVPGRHVKLSNGKKLPVLTVTEVNTPRYVWHIEVKSTNSYFMGESRVLVHNNTSSARRPRTTFGYCAAADDNNFEFCDPNECKGTRQNQAVRSKNSKYSEAYDGEQKTFPAGYIDAGAVALHDYGPAGNTSTNFYIYPRGSSCRMRFDCNSGVWRDERGFPDFSKVLKKPVSSYRNKTEKSKVGAGETQSAIVWQIDMLAAQRVKDVLVRFKGNDKYFQGTSTDLACASDPQQFKILCHAFVDELKKEEVDGIKQLAARFEAASNIRADSTKLREYCEKAEVANPVRIHPATQKDEPKGGNGKFPNLTWHHHQKEGLMQLIPFSVHAKLGHTGGRSLWGGGKPCREDGCSTDGKAPNAVHLVPPGGAAWNGSNGNISRCTPIKSVPFQPKKP